MYCILRRTVPGGQSGMDGHQLQCLGAKYDYDFSSKPVLDFGLLE